MAPSLAAIVALMVAQGHQHYDGEAISQLDHALQCATLAEAANRSSELIAACLLHDIGHLVPSVAGTGVDGDGGDRHEQRAMPWLQGLFGAAITEPIRLHVAAKRYLCVTDRTYWASLSPASQQSLERQGGIFSRDDAAGFIRQPYAREAVQLRQWDDRAKTPHLKTPDLHHFIPILQHWGFAV
jgi:phosphonate degradation associated HDIG domain protein